MADSLNLQFFNDTGLGLDEVFVTFQNPSKGSNNFDITYGNGIPVTIADGNIMSESLSLQTIGEDGFSIQMAIGVVIYISYGAPLTSTTSAPSYLNPEGTDFGTPFQPFELTRTGSETDQGNLTAINYFTAIQKIVSRNGGPNGKILQEKSYYTLSADIAAKIFEVSPGAITINKNGDIVRYIGPSSYPPPGGLPKQTWPSFDDYLGSITAAGQITKIQNHNAFDNDGINYDFSLDMTAEVGSGNNIEVAGQITTKLTPGGDGPTFEDASIAIPGYPDDALNYIIYGQVAYENMVWGEGWRALQSYVNEKGLGPAFEMTQSLAMGEITTGLLLGFFNSSVVPQGKTIPLKDMPSQEWWTLDPMIAFSQVQQNPLYYNQYADIIYQASHNQAYSIPFSDRLGSGPLVNTVSYKGQTVDTWVVGLGAPIPSSTP